MTQVARSGKKKKKQSKTSEAGAVASAAAQVAGVPEARVQCPQSGLGNTLPEMGLLGS